MRCTSADLFVALGWLDPPCAQFSVFYDFCQGTTMLNPEFRGDRQGVSTEARSDALDFSYRLIYKIVHDSTLQMVDRR
jgi:hypothetical protein